MVLIENVRTVRSVGDVLMFVYMHIRNHGAFEH